MAAMPIYGRNSAKNFISGTAEPIATKLNLIYNLLYWRLEYYNVFINHDPVMTLIKALYYGVRIVKML